MITTDEKAKIIKSAQKSKTDTGSAEVQVSMLTARIADLTSHLKTHKKDNHSRRGLLQMVGKRKRLLSYLKNSDFPAYETVVKSLGLRG